MEHIPVHAIGDEDRRLKVYAQTRKHSMREAAENIFWGFLISGAINYFWIQYMLTGNSLADAIVMTAILTITSFARAYIIRRWNNYRQTHSPR